MYPGTKVYINENGIAQYQFSLPVLSQIYSFTVTRIINSYKPYKMHKSILVLAIVIVVSATSDDLHSLDNALKGDDYEGVPLESPIISVFQAKSVCRMCPAPCNHYTCCGPNFCCRTGARCNCCREV
ncbi:unnamed protein product [Orchesella dallaii]|uniref:Uncharacterized protein n=1 Tax=Orchesella dallaii TaxID=48710 RepID=A0ABP1RII0_9HEXA